MYNIVTMNRLNVQRQAQVIRALVEGNSVRSTVRITGAAKNTVMKLLIDIGEACSDYQDKALRGLTCRRVQCDEIWSFVYAKEKNVPDQFKGEFGFGDVWTWTALDADSKLVLSWQVGNRDYEYAKVFIDDVASRLANRVQLTTDGHKAYLEAVEGAFGSDIDYAMLIKLYGPEPESEKRYGPAACIGAETRVITGKPDPKHISTSYSELRTWPMPYRYTSCTTTSLGSTKHLK